MKIHQIEYEADESELADLDGARVEMKGTGPRVLIFTKNRIKVTNKRIIIGQKIIFSSKHHIRYIIWFHSRHVEKLSFLTGIVETMTSMHDINEIEYKGNKVTEIRPGADSVIDFLHIFVNKLKLNLPEN